MNTTKLGIGLTLIVTMGIGLSGCVLDEIMGDPYYADPPPTSWGEPAYASNVDVKDASLVGDVGSVQNITGPAAYTEAFGDSAWANVNVHSTGSRGFAMGAISFEGGLNHADLTPGADLHFTNRGYNDDSYDASALNVTVLGCSGPSDGDWQYDEPADDVEVKVTEGAEPGYLHFVITAHWNDRGQDATAEFEAQETPADPGATDPYGDDATPAI